MLIHVLAGVARVKFLTLTLVCVALASAVSWYDKVQFNGWDVLLISVVALSAHISVNAFNEYLDFRSGLDFNTRKTPFSGGSGTLNNSPEYAPFALGLAFFSLLFTIGSGLVLVAKHGTQLLLIGLPGLLIIYFYTQTINRIPWLCLIAPGIGFGLLMTLGACWVLEGGISPAAWWVSAIMMLLVSNLLLLNQFPDLEADREVGRRHIPIVYGRAKSARLFVAIHLLAVALLCIAVAVHHLPLQSLLGLLIVPLLFRLFPGVVRFADEPNKLEPMLGLNVLVVHLFPLGILLGLIWGAHSG